MIPTSRLGNQATLSALSLKFNTYRGVSYQPMFRETLVETAGTIPSPTRPPLGESQSFAAHTLTNGQAPAPVSPGAAGTVIDVFV